MAPALETLPPELQEAIGAYCILNKPPKDSAALRLTCRALQSATRCEWVREFFGGRYLWFDVKHLLSFIEISKVPELADAVTRLVIYCPDDMEAISDARRPDLQQCSPLLVTLFQRLKHVTKLEFINEEDAGGRYRDDGRLISSLSFSFENIMFTAQACGWRPKCIVTYPFDNLQHNTGFLSCASLEHMQKCFSALEEFGVEILMHSSDDGTHLVSAQVGRQLSTGCNYMHALRELRLELGCTVESQQVMDTFTRSVYLPHLEYINLCDTMLFTDHFNRFIRKHRATLKKLCLTWIFFSETVPSDKEFHTFLEEIRDNLNLEFLLLNSPRSQAGLIRFAGMSRVFWDEEPNEDGYIDVELVEGSLELESHEEIRTAIPHLISSISYQPLTV